MPNYVLSVGMEVHAELLTESKMFCRCPVAFGGEPNTRVCPICLGFPGTLPVPNQKAIEIVLKTALALNCKIAMDSIFHRKNYFYPDLPKGYQVSQYGETNPLGYEGYLEIHKPDGTYKKIYIRRVHLEEDTGKLMHLPSGESGIDYNRAGTPLMEIVTEFPPDIESPEEAKEYLAQLRQILIYIGACDGKMEEGSLRCEPNISVRPEGSTKYGIKTELKNLNSFKSVQHGIQYEENRQIEILEAGGTLHQETRGWDEAKGASFAMRIKEEENDYRYFPDPDLVPMSFTEEYIESLRNNLPELPLQKFKRYQEKFGLSNYDAGVLIAERNRAEYFEKAVALGGDPKLVCNWMNSDLAKLLNENGQDITTTKFTPNYMVDLIKLVQSDQISGKIAKSILPESFETGTTPSQIVKDKELTQIGDADSITNHIKEVLNENPDVLEKYKSGQTNVMGFLVGQVMKKTSGRANPGMVKELLEKYLAGE